MGAFSFLPRKPLIGLAVAAIAGIAVADWCPLPLMAVLVGASVLAGAALRWQRVWLCWIFFGVAFAALHAVRVIHGSEAALASQVAARPLPAEATGVVWSEPVPFTSSRGEPLAIFQIQTRTLRLGPGSSNAAVLCAVHWVGKAPAYGDVVRVRGEARRLAEPTNPGEFDTAQWQRRKGVAVELHAWSRSDCDIVGHGQGSRVEHFAIGARAWVKGKLEEGMNAPEESALIESMVLGLRGETPPEMKELFQKTGTLHLFAVSGLNVAMLAWMVWALLKPLRLSRFAAFFVAVPVLWAYAIATGLGASCVRATIMAMFVLAAPVLNRPAVMLNSMAGAALVILVWDTNELFQPGFQLSFILVLCLILMADPIARWLERRMHPDDFIPKPLWSRWQRIWTWGWRHICVATGVTLAAWMGSLPFMAGYFHLVSPVAIVANALAVPIAFLVLALGLMSLMVSFTPLLSVVNAANWACAKALLITVGFFAKVPLGHMYVEWPDLRRAPACEITVLDVRDGAAIHLRAGGTDWLLDAGHSRDYPRIVLPYLRSRGIDWLDGLLLTHGDSGHVGGALEAVRDFAPAWIADSPFLDRSPIRRALHAELARMGRGRRFPLRGDVYPLSAGATLTVLYPPPLLERNSSDDRAMVCRIDAAGRRILLVSDAGFFTEEWLLKNEADLKADVLVKGWHSSDFSGTPDFLARVAPKAVVCSAPEFGAEQARLAKWVEPLAAQGISIFSQQHCGAVRIEVGKDGELRVEGVKR